MALRPLLPRRGLGHRQPLALHRRRAAGGAEVLPRHPAGRRGAPLGLLQALHARGRRRRRRHDGRRPARHRRRDHVGPPPGLQPPGPDGRRAAPRPLEDQARRGGDALPRRRRGLAGPARAAHDRGLARGSSTCCPASARACATSRSTSSATSASASSCWPTSTARTPARSRTRSSASSRRSCRGPRRWPSRRTGTAPTRSASASRWRTWARSGAASIEQRLRAIGLPIDTIPGFPMPMDLPPRERAVRGQKLLRAGLIGPGDDGVAQDPEAIEIMFDTIRRGAITDGVRPGHDDRVGLRRRRAVARRARQRRARARCRAARRSADLTLRLRFADWADVMAGPRRPAGADAAPAAAAEGEPAGAAGAAEGLRVVRANSASREGCAVRAC